MVKRNKNGVAEAAELPPVFQEWFAWRGWAPRRHQLEMIEKARAGRDALLIAPTGGGKTLAGFLPTLVELHGRGPVEGAGVHTLYISPLKALAVDVQRNLETPAREMGLAVSIESRTGDTSVGKRQRQRERPPDILLTTPEQLALFCAWEGSREYFRDLRCVILDEIHTLQPSKRGDLLSLGLARLQALAPGMRRVGLSATVDDPDMLRRWLGSGSSPVHGGGTHGEPRPRRARGAGVDRGAAVGEPGAVVRHHRAARHAGGLCGDSEGRDHARVRQHAVAVGVRVPGAVAAQ